jgi:hypothetical protein
VRHGNEPTSACRTRRSQVRGIQEKLRVPVGLLDGHFFAQGCVQTAHSGGLGGAVHTKDYDAHVVRSNVLPMVSETFGISDAGSQHPPGGISNVGTTTARVDGSAGRARSVPGLITQTLLSLARPWLVRVFQTRRTVPPVATFLEGAETAVSLFAH